MPVEDARSQRELTRTFDSIMRGHALVVGAARRRQVGARPREEGERGPEPAQRADAARPRAGGRRGEHRFPRRADSPADALGTMERVRVAIVDVGANTLRLLVAVPDGRRGAARA